MGIYERFASGHLVERVELIEAGEAPPSAGPVGREAARIRRLIEQREVAGAVDGWYRAGEYARLAGLRQRFEPLRVAELDTELSDRGLSTDGDKPTKVTRLVAHEATRMEQENRMTIEGQRAGGYEGTHSVPSPAVGEPATSGQPPQGDAYDDMNVDALQDELRNRTDAEGEPLKVSGTKPELVERLRANDRQQSGQG